MVSGGSIYLHFQAQSTLLEMKDGPRISLRVSVDELVNQVLKHDPPTAIELELAIDLIEESLTGTAAAFKEFSELTTTDAILCSLPGLRAPGSSLTRDAVENLFSQLASRSLGTPVSAEILPEGKITAAAVLILRECMHHLRFDRVVALPDSSTKA